MAQSTRPALEHFDDHLGRGGELLREGDVAGAKQEFVAALKLRPEDSKALGLLGLAYFQLGAFEDALPIYEKLVELNQSDASYWLNLGLVHLKLGKADMAIIELTKSRELDPSQIRTVSYLGLAYARQVSYARAYEAFLQADELPLAREMERHLSEAERESIARRLAERNEEQEATPRAPVLEESGDELDADDIEEITDADVEEVSEAEAEGEGEGETEAEAETETETETETEAEAEAEAETEAEADIIDELGAAATATNIDAPEPVEDRGPVFPEAEEDEDEERAEGSWFDSQSAIPVKIEEGLITRAVQMAAPSQAAQAGALKVASGHEPPRSLSEFATSRLIRPEDGEHPFEIAVTGELIIRVDERIMSRTENVIVSGGDLGFEVATRRVRGELTDELFGEGGEKKLFVVTGDGFLVASPAGGRFTAVSLDDDILYVRESLVYAFEEVLSWENGNVPGSEPKIHVVQFRGTGCVALRSTKALTGVKLASEKVLYVEAAVLAGWVGRVVPRLVPPVTGSAASAPFVECSGEGVVLIEDPGSRDS